MDISKAAAAYSNTNSIGGIADKSKNAVSMGEEKSEISPKFSELVSEGLESARSGGYKAEAVSTEALTGKAEIHDLVTSISNAELTLTTITAVRDRMVTAYQDIIKMPI